MTSCFVFICSTYDESEDFENDSADVNLPLNSISSKNQEVNEKK